MYSIYDQNLIFVVYEGGFSGSFLSILLNSVVTKNASINISESGHCHNNPVIVDKMLANFHDHICNFTGDTSYFDSLKFDDVRTHVIKTHSQAIRTHKELFPKCKQIVVSFDETQHLVGDVNLFLKHTMENMVHRPGALVHFYYQIKTMLRDMIGKDASKEKLNDIARHLIYSTKDPSLTSVYITAAAHRRLGEQFVSNFIDESVVYLQYSSIVNNKANDIIDAFERVLGYKIPQSDQINIAENLSRYASKQFTGLTNNQKDFLTGHAEKAKTILDTLLREGPNTTSYSNSDIFDHSNDCLILSNTTLCHLLTNISYDIYRDTNLLYSRLCKIRELSEITPDFVDYQKITIRINFQFRVEEVIDFNDFMFLKQTFNWKKMLIIENDSGFDYETVVFFNTIVLKYHTSVDSLVSSFLASHPEFTPLGPWMKSNVWHKHVNNILYAVWIMSDQRAEFRDMYETTVGPTDSSVITMSAGLIRNCLTDELVQVLENLLDTTVTAKQKLMIAEVLKLYNQIMFDNQVYTSREEALKRILLNFELGMSWLRSTMLK